jgi:acyl-CoA synthetase
VSTVSAVVAHNAATNPEGVAFAEAASGASMTWREYDEQATRVAATLLEHDRGERVALEFADGPDAHTAMVACERAGLVAVGIGARAGARETDDIMRRTGALSALTSLPEGIDAAAPLRPLDDGELWYLNCTSGTTGLPKIVMHDQKRWFAFHEIAQRIAHFDADDVFLSAIPTPFGFGLWTAHFTPAIVGAPCVVCERFSAETVLAAIERYRVSILAAVSTQFIMMLNSAGFDAYDLSSLRVLFTGGEMVPYERALEFEQRTGARVLQFYGSNETGALSATTLEDPQELRLRTAGRVIPEMRVRLLDAETDADITAGGGPGIPAGKGPTLCLGYWDDPAGNRALFTRDGWMRMGDLATIDADGYLTVAGRTSDFIIRGGKNVSAAHVESEVASHPSVALCAAVPMPDATFGERVCVFAELRPGAALDLETLRAHLEHRGTGKDYWPERLVVLDALPRAPGGKLAKGELHRRASDLSGD